jgi:hypothetical protein
MTTQLSPQELEKLGQKRLINLVNRGIISVMTAYPITMTTKTDLPEYQRHAHLKGHPISIGNASRKYGIPQPTISRWVSRGIITKLGMDKNRVLIDEADIAYCAEIRSQNPGAGRWLFNPDGTPYTG